MTRNLCIGGTFLAFLASALLAVSCGGGGPDGDPVGIRLQFLDGEGGTLPGSVTSLTITVAPYAQVASTCTPPDPEPISVTFQVTEMTDLDENGRREAVLSDIPFGCALHATVEAMSGTTRTHSGRADGIVLSREGTRRFIEMTLTPEDSVSVLETTLDSPAFGLTATALAETDGRVLVAGGFTAATSVTCESPYETTDLCFELTATDEAYLFDQGSGRIHPTQGQMLAARALHSATLLPDGRVMIAGGVSRALLVLRGAGGTPSWAGWEIVTIEADGGTLPLDTYEIFDPEMNPETSDDDRDGDPARGGFEATVPGSMRFGRFGHAASVLATPGLPSTDERRVLLSGGFGIGAGTSIDVFTLDHSSTQIGFLTGSLSPDSADRTAPASVMLDGYIWVFGGVSMPGDLTTANLAVAERWDASDSGDEWNIGPVTFDSFTTDHPEWVRMHPSAVRLGSTGSVILVTGWYGSRCMDSGGPLATYEYVDGGGTPIPTYICPAPDTTFMGTGDFIVDVDPATPTIEAADLTEVPHALASVVRLEQGSREGEVLVAGGIVDGDFTCTGVIDLYTGETAPGSMVDTSFPSDEHSLNYPRALGAAVELGGGNVVFLGGADFSLGSSAITILDSVEILNWQG